MINDGLHAYRGGSHIWKDSQEGLYGVCTVLNAFNKAVHLKITSACWSYSWEDTSLYFEKICHQEENELEGTNTFHMMLVNRIFSIHSLFERLCR